MAGWNELLAETKELGGVHDVIRRRHLRKLNRITKRNVVIYYSGWLQKPHLREEHGVTVGISDADKNGMMSAIHKMKRQNGLDLILHTPGGDLAATESLVEYLNVMFSGDIRAFIPQLAMSGGTIIALGCKSIHMGKQSSIGPIDPQFGPMSAQGLLDEFQGIRAEIKKDPDSASWDPILRQIEPGFITECSNAVKWSKTMAEKFLKQNMFFGVPNASARIKKIVDGLTEPKKTYSHGRHIGLEAAAELFGDRLHRLEDNQPLQDAILTVHHATMIMLQGTPAYKIIENHSGRAFVQMAEMRAVTS